MNAKITIGIVLFALLLILSTTTANAQKLAGMSAIAFNPEFTQVKVDNRAKILEKYLKQYDSPLADHAQTFITTADTYDLDWKLVVSIAGLESGYGKAIPVDSYNGWGWGIYGTNVHYFSSWDDGIETVSKGLRKNYLGDEKEANIYAIGRKYASSPTWAERVIANMERLKKFADTFENSSIQTLSLSI